MQKHQTSSLACCQCIPFDPINFAFVYALCKYSSEWVGHLKFYWNCGEYAKKANCSCGVRSVHARNMVSKSDIHPIREQNNTMWPSCPVRTRQWCDLCFLSKWFEFWISNTHSQLLTNKLQTKNKLQKLPGEYMQQDTTFMRLICSYQMICSRLFITVHSPIPHHDVHYWSPWRANIKANKGNSNIHWVDAKPEVKGNRSSPIQRTDKSQYAVPDWLPQAAPRAL